MSSFDRLINCAICIVLDEGVFRILGVYNPKKQFLNFADHDFGRGINANGILAE